MKKNQPKKIDTIIVLLINQANNCYCFIEQNGKCGASQKFNANLNNKKKQQKIIEKK